MSKTSQSTIPVDNPALNRWSTALDQQMAAQKVTIQQLARVADISVVQLRRLLEGQNQPRQETLRTLAHATLKTGIWKTEAEVVDWMAFLEVSTQETLELLKCEEIDSDYRSLECEEGVQSIRSKYHWHPATLLPPDSAEYFERDIQSQVIADLLSLENFQRPKFRAVILSSNWPTEAQSLITHLVRHPRLQDFFRDGIYWLDGQNASRSSALSLLLDNVRQAQGTKSIAPSLDFQHNRQTWRAWAGVPQRNALIVVDALNDPQLIEPIITNAGSQVRYLITTSLSESTLSPVIQWLNATHTSLVQLLGYSKEETERLVQTKSLSLTSEAQGRLDYVRTLSRGAPDLMRWYIQELANGADLPLPTLIEECQKRGWVSAVRGSLRREPDTLDRPGLVQSIRDAVRKHPGKPIILYGASGIGKRTLLTLIANDPALRLQFPDGTRQVKPTPNESDSRLSPIQSAMLFLNEEMMELKPSQWQSHLRNSLAGKRAMLFLENWTNVSSVRELRNTSSDSSLMVITTESDHLIRSLDVPSSCVIAVPVFTLAETETYFEYHCQLQQREMTDQDRQLVSILFERTRGRPIELTNEIRQAVSRQKETSLSLPQSVSTPESTKLELQVEGESKSGSDPESIDAFQRAYNNLTSEAQACFRRLGSGPELDSYDRIYFSSLWPSTVESRVSEILNSLESAGNLVTRHIDQTEAPYWQIHPLAFKLTHHLQQRDGKSDRYHARHWLDRAAQSPTQQERYREFRRQVAQHSRGQKFWQDLVLYTIPSRVPRWQRLLHYLVRPDIVTEWDAVQEHSHYLSSAEMILFYQLTCEERRARYWIFGVFWWIIGTGFLYKMTEPDPGWSFRIGGLVVLWLIAVCVVFFRLFFVELIRIPAWRYLWLQVNHRINAPLSK
jgi:transcriptional regulator with XRE-family HTH domain